VEILTVADMIRAFGVSFGYLIATAGFFSIRTKFSCITYWMFIFAINIIYLLSSSVTLINLVAVLITGIYISWNHGVFKGFGFAITIFAAFQWTIAFVGSGTFLIFYYSQILDGVNFTILFTVAIVATSLLLRKYRHFVFQDTSRKLLLIDTLAKLFFIVFFNTFLPRFFPILGVVSYSTLTLVLLIVAVIFVAYKEYSVSLESLLAKEHSKLQAVLAWADRTLTKYMSMEFPQFKHLNQIENSVVKALLYEFIDTAHRQGITVDVSIETTIGKVNLDSYDLFNTISDFMKYAMERTVTHEDKKIYVVINGKSGFHFLVKTNLAPSENGIKSSIETRKKEIMALVMKNTNSNVTINSHDGKFIQLLSVM